MVVLGKPTVVTHAYAPLPRSAPKRGTGCGELPETADIAGVTCMHLSVVLFQLTNLQTGTNLCRRCNGDAVSSGHLINNLFQNVNEYDMLFGLNA